MVDCLVRLGMALCVIVLITACLYQFGGRAVGSFDVNAAGLHLKTKAADDQ